MNQIALTRGGMGHIVDCRCTDTVREPFRVDQLDASRRRTVYPRRGLGPDIKKMSRIGNKPVGELFPLRDLVDLRMGVRPLGVHGTNGVRRWPSRRVRRLAFARGPRHIRPTIKSLVEIGLSGAKRSASYDGNVIRLLSRTGIA